MKRVIISGGGTGGHIFPAISIGKTIRAKYPNCEILYVGADGGMEVNLVKKAGFQIETVSISGFYRTPNLKNLIRNASLPVKYFYSQWQATRIMKQFQPEIVIGVGGYASFPVLNQAIGRKGVKTVIQEQNAFPGLVNRRLGNKVDLVLMGNADAASYFTKTKAVYSGNPIRAELLNGDKQKAIQKYELNPDKKVLLVTGGSLGARGLNDPIEAGLEKFWLNNIQVLWQCGSFYYEALQKRAPQLDNYRLLPFIDDMGAAYAASDLVVCRAGASTISELIALNQPAILAPSPNVADDHQTKNALSLTKLDCAVLMKEADLKNLLVDNAIALMKDDKQLMAMKSKLAKIEKVDANAVILKALEDLI